MASQKVTEEKNELSKDKTGAQKLVNFPKGTTVDDIPLPQKKVYKRLASSARDGPNINKDRPKKSSSKAVSTIASKDKSSLVNGEAKIG